jgi:hypothetical protein
MADKPEAAPKRSIRPLTFVVEVTATRVSDKGTFSGLQAVKLIKAPAKVNALAMSPPMAGGAIYVRLDMDRESPLDGVTIIDKDENVAKGPRKLF